MHTALSCKSGVLKTVLFVVNTICFVEIVDKETGDRLSKIVDEACLLLADYNGRLAAELEDRATISKMLAAFIQLQRDKLAESEKKLQVGCFVENRLEVVWPFSF